MNTVLALLSLLTIPQSGEFWVVTENNAREASVINVGSPIQRDGQDFVLISTFTVHRQGTEESGWTTPAYTREFIAFRCRDRTFHLRSTERSSGVHDPIRTSDTSGAFISVTTDPKRERQAEAVCRPRSEFTDGFPTTVAFMQAHGLWRQPEVTPPLPGPQPYPQTAEDRRRQAERVLAAEERGGMRPPRIGLEASSLHNPGGIPVMGYSRTAGGRLNTEFYLMGSWGREPAGPAVVFVRRALDSYEAQEQIQWADSRTCPGLVEALLAANDLPLPLMILPLDEASRASAREAGYSTPPAADGPGAHVFWAPARGPVANSIQFSTFGGAWVEWSNGVDRVLEPCWSDDQPIRPARN
jgi:hypothetical protein